MLSRMIRIEKNVGVLLGVGDGVDSRYRHSWYVFEMVSSRDVIESVQSVDSRWRAFYIYRQSTPNCRLVYTPSARATSTWRDVHRVKKAGRADWKVTVRQWEDFVSGFSNRTTTIRKRICHYIFFYLFISICTII